MNFESVIQVMERQEPFIRKMAEILESPGIQRAIQSAQEVSDRLSSMGILTRVTGQTQSVRMLMAPSPVVAPLKHHAITPVFSEVATLPSPTVSHTGTIKVSIEKNGVELFVIIGDEKYLIHKFQEDRTPEMVMNFLLNIRPNTSLSRNVVENGIKRFGLDIPEVVRLMNHGKYIKKYFAKGCTRNKVHITTEIHLKNEEFEVFKTDFGLTEVHRGE